MSHILSLKSGKFQFSGILSMSHSFRALTNFRKKTGFVFRLWCINNRKYTFSVIYSYKYRFISLTMYVYFTVSQPLARVCFLPTNNIAGNLFTRCLWALFCCLWALYFAVCERNISLFVSALFRCLWAQYFAVCERIISLFVSDLFRCLWALYFAVCKRTMPRRRLWQFSQCP